MKTILAILLTVLLLLPVSALGEIQTITHTVKQPFGGSQSPDDARISAVHKAKREALELAGTYIESLTVVKNYQVDKDEILALSAGVLRAEVVSQKNYASDDAFGIDVIVKVIVDTSVLEERVKIFLQDRTHLDQYKDAQKRELELLKKVVQLEQENRMLTEKKESTEKLKKEFQDVSRGLTAIEWFYKAVELIDFEKKKYTDQKKAIEYLSNAIKLQPDYVLAYLARGAAFGSNDPGQHQRAIQDYDTAIRLKPDIAEAYGVRGDAYASLGQHQKAIQDYDMTIRLKPDYALAYHIRGVAYVKLGQHQRAIQDYDTAIRLKPDDAMAYGSRGSAYANLGQHQRAIQDYDTAIRLKPDDAMAYGSRGSAYANMGQYQRAILDYDTAIRLNPDDATAYHIRGVCYSRLEQYQRAIQDYDTAIRLKPDDAMAYNNRGFAYANLGQYQRAIQDYDTLIRLKPDEAMTYNNRGFAYASLGQHKRAIQDYDTAIRLKPDYVEAYGLRGLAYGNLGQQQRAIQDFDTAIRLKPNDNGGYYNYACFFSLQKNTTQACKWLGLAIERGYTNWKYMETDKDFDNIRNEKCFVDILNNLSAVSAPLPESNPADALAPPEIDAVVATQNEVSLRALLMTNPKNLDALIQLGNLYYDIGQFTQAVEWYGKALEVNPRNPDVRTDRGASYWSLNRPDEAIAEFQKSLQVDPGHAQTLYNMGLVYLQGKNNAVEAKKAWQKLLAAHPNYPNRADIERQLAAIEVPPAKK